MKIDDDTARRLAGLASISLDDDELPGMVRDLEKIIEYIGELKNLDTSGVEPTISVTGLSNVWREDIVEPQLPREELLKLAQERNETAVRVPKVL